MAVHSNELVSLPSQLGKNFSNLQSLYLHKNRLTVLPNSLGKIASLVILKLSEQPSLRKLPDELDWPLMRTLEFYKTDIAGMHPSPS